MQSFQSFSFKHLLSPLLLILVITSCLHSNLTFAADVAGRIIMARGEVQAINSEGIIRSLKRRDSVYSHEIIKTGKKSKVQIRFIDNALLALKANSELNIKAYVYSEANEKDNQVLMELVTGGFRTLTGKIGKGNKEAYKVNTPVASIGIRGTLYDVQISFDKILAGVWKGGISLDTAQGQFDLGMNSNFDFGEISANGAFTGLLTPPESFTPPTAQNKDNTNNENDSNTNSESDSTPTQNFATNDNANATTEVAAIESQPTNNAIPSPFEKEQRPEKESTQEGNNFTPAKPGTTPGTTPTTPSDPETPLPTTSPDSRLTDAEIKQLVSRNKLAILLGNGNKEISIALKTNGTGETFFLTPSVAADGTQSYETIRRGDATEKDFSGKAPWSDQVDWGIWQGSKESPVKRFTTFNNNQDFTSLEKDLFYMVAQPASTTELNAGIVDGTMTFSTSSSDLSGTGKTDFIASSSLGNVMNVKTQFDLTASSNNYSISNLHLNATVDTNSDNRADHMWNMTANSGQVAGANIKVDNLAGNFVIIPSDTTIQAKGSLNGILLAPKVGSTKIDTFAGGFELLTADGTNHRVGGVVILQAGQPQSSQ